MPGLLVVIYLWRGVPKGSARDDTQRTQRLLPALFYGPRGNLFAEAEGPQLRTVGAWGQASPRTSHNGQLTLDPAPRMASACCITSIVRAMPARAKGGELW